MIIYTISSACGFLLSSVMRVNSSPGATASGGASATLGASAAICGLVGALLHYGNRGGSSMIRTARASIAR